MSEDEIQKLLKTGVERPQAAPTAKQYLKEPQEANLATKPAQSQEAPSSATPEKDIPPIITYPEHLFQPPEPSPLITLPRLFNAATVITTAVALTYGTKKYIIEPMLDSLTSARHELFSAALENVKTMNTKLEGTVSIAPGDGKDEDLQEDSDESDGATFFHREIGTQTSPHLSRSASSSSQESPSQPTALETQAKHIQTINSGLKTFLVPDSLPTEDSKATPSLKRELMNIQSYLDGLMQGPVENTQGYRARKEEDEIGKVRMELRLAKGALLSARNFPAAGGPGRSGLTSV